MKLIALKKHNGKEFISIGPLLNDGVYHDLDRVRYYHWFSITDECARFILNKENDIHRIFKYSFCADELFVQTIIAGTKFEKRIYNPANSLRFIDWKRAQPWTWKL